MERLLESLCHSLPLCATLALCCRRCSSYHCRAFSFIQFGAAVAPFEQLAECDWRPAWIGHSFHSPDFAHNNATMDYVCYTVLLLWIYGCLNVSIHISVPMPLPTKDLCKRYLGLFQRFIIVQRHITFPCRKELCSCLGSVFYALVPCSWTQRLCHASSISIKPMFLAPLYSTG